MSDATFWGLGLTTGTMLGLLTCLLDDLIRNRRFERATESAIEVTRPALTHARDGSVCTPKRGDQ